MWRGAAAVLTPTKPGAPYATKTPESLQIPYAAVLPPRYRECTYGRRPGGGGDSNTRRMHAIQNESHVARPLFSQTCSGRTVQEQFPGPLCPALVMAPSGEA